MGVYHTEVFVAQCCVAILTFAQVYLVLHTQYQRPLFVCLRTQ